MFPDPDAEYRGRRYSKFSAGGCDSLLSQLGAWSSVARLFQPEPLNGLESQ